MWATLPVIMPHYILHTKRDLCLTHPLNPKFLLKTFYSVGFFYCVLLFIYKSLRSWEFIFHQNFKYCSLGRIWYISANKITSIEFLFHFIYLWYAAWRFRLLRSRAFSIVFHKYSRVNYFLLFYIWNIIRCTQTLNTAVTTIYRI
jgi:hypothetical protein